MKNVLLTTLIGSVMLARAVTFPLSFLHFEEGATITPQGYATLDSLAMFLKDTGIQVEVSGHTDNVGHPEGKMLLSQARAQAICDYLVNTHNIPRENMVPKGYGPSMPIASNVTEKGRAQNNRIEIKILSPIPEGRIKYVSGDALIRKKGLSAWTDVAIDQVVTAYDHIRTDDTGWVSLDFEKAGKIFVSSNADLSLVRLAPEQGQGELLLQSGKVIIRQKGELQINTPLLSLHCHAAELTVESRPYTGDLISVWKGSVMVHTERDSFEIPAGYGIRCFTGHAPEQPRPLAPAPEIGPLSAQGQFYYDPDQASPFAFHFNTLPNLQSHVIITRDAGLDEVMCDIMTSKDSCVIPAEDLPAIFLVLSTIDSLGLESRPIVYDFAVGKAGGPRLNLTGTRIEKEDNYLVVFVDGQTDPNCVLTINNEPVTIGKDGRFSLKARVKPGTKKLVIVATNPTGKKASRMLSLVPMPRLAVKLWFGAADMVGGNFSSLMTSNIGFFFGGNIAYRIGSRSYLCALADHGAVSVESKVQDTVDYRTTMTMGGLGLQHPVISGLRVRLDAGMTIWKSFAGDDVLDWGVDPFAGVFLGYETKIAGRVKLFMELGSDYMFNKTQANLGSGVYYIVPKMYAGVGL